MPRQARTISSTGIYHVMMRGINRQNIFRDKLDRLKFLKFLQNSIKKISVEDGVYEVYAYALMSNHFHLLVRVISGHLGDMIKKLASGYVLYYNKKYGRDGHLFKERFKSETCENDDYFYTLLRYIHQNPIKAGWTGELIKYKYTSWQEYKDPENCPVKICNCDYVLQRLPLSELENKVFEILSDNTKCIDIDKSRGQISDESIVQFLRGTHNTDPAEIKTAKPERRNGIVKDLLQFGASISQISRISGISKAVVSRLKG